MNCKKTEKGFLAYLHSHPERSPKFYPLISSVLQVLKLDRNGIFWLQLVDTRYFKTRKVIAMGGVFFNKPPGMFSCELTAGLLDLFKKISIDCFLKPFSFKLYS